MGLYWGYIRGVSSINFGLCAIPGPLSTRRALPRPEVCGNIFFTMLDEQNQAVDMCMDRFSPLNSASCFSFGIVVGTRQHSSLLSVYNCSDCHGLCFFCSKDLVGGPGL